MKANRRARMDWLLFAVLAIGLIAFFWMVSSTHSAVGQATGLAYAKEKGCYHFDSGLPVVVTDELIVLCGNSTHLVDYFVIQADQATIDCQGSTVKGVGGALLLPEYVVSPRVTLKGCVVEGYGGLYSSRNPVDVYMVD